MGKHGRGSWPARGVLRVFFTGLLLGLSAIELSAVRPDFSTARAFGEKLQQDYRARGTQALLERLDQPGMIERVFSADAMSREERASLQKVWEEQLFPTLSKQLAAVDRFKTLMVSRVILSQDARALECLFLDDAESFIVGTFFLSEPAMGEPRIVDLRFSDASLNLLRQLRQLFLLLQVPLPGVTDPEEIDLIDFGKFSRGSVQAALLAMQKQRPDEAFNAWQRVSNDLKKTTLWRETRTKMAFAGSKAAMLDLDRELQTDPKGNAFVRFSRAMTADDHARALVAINDVLRDYRQLAFLRVVKGELLLKVGRPEEALALAEDIYSCTPFSGGAYFLAVHAGCALGRTENTIAAIERWMHLTPPEEIARLIEAEPSIAKFVASPWYRDWKQKNIAGPASLTAPEKLSEAKAAPTP
jgi:hypothetical protein